MNTTEIKEKTLALYRARQEYARTQPQDGRFDSIKLSTEVPGRFSYCDEYAYYGYTCSKCPLRSIDSIDSSCNHCDGLWLEMRQSETWAEYLERSEKVVNYIIEKG